MIINYKVVFKDEDGNLFYSPITHGIMTEIIAYLTGKTYETVKESLPIDTRYTIEYDIKNNTKLSDILIPYSRFLGWQEERLTSSLAAVKIKTETDLVQIRDFDYKIQRFFSFYPGLRSINLYIVFSTLQGVVWTDNSIRYYMYSNESCSHNKPHVHVDVSHEYQASIDIIDGTILAGCLPGKHLKQAIKTINEKRDYFLDCWNKRTSGLYVDMNNGLGLTELRE